MVVLKRIKKNMKRKFQNIMNERRGAATMFFLKKRNLSF